MSHLSIDISIDQQTLTLRKDGKATHTWPISSAAKGVGFKEGSYRTPTGHFVISDKIGAKAAVGTQFKGREECGIWTGESCCGDLILSRILWLAGTDSENLNTHDRFIYIHGTNHEELLGQPASCGCIRMSNLDVVELFDLVEEGTEVRIHPPTQKRGKLIFFDCDSTLSSIEGIDELGRACGDEVFKQVEAMTNDAMNGIVPLDEVFQRRMEIIQPTREIADRVAELYLHTITPGIRELIQSLQCNGWTPIILSGGFAPLIKPLAAHLGIRHMEAVPLYFNEDGSYAGYGKDYPTTRNGGKPDIIREWKDALLPERIVMVGDGISDLESRKEADLFVGYGGVVQRSAVKNGADLWVTDFTQFDPLSLEDK